MALLGINGMEWFDLLVFSSLQGLVSKKSISDGQIFGRNTL